MGGLIGYGNDTYVKSSFFSGTITSSGAYAGGILGGGSAPNMIDVFSSGSVTGTTGIGGLSGYSMNFASNRSFSTANVTATSTSNAGGL